MIHIEYRCEICHSKFNTYSNTPRILPCGHTLCLKCINRLKSSSVLKCPFDRKSIDLHSDDFPINYYLLSLFEANDTQSSFQYDCKEELHLNPLVVLNPHGWREIIEGILLDNILFTVEVNENIYATHLETGSWWLVLNKFNGKFFFKTNSDNLCIVDYWGNLFLVDKHYCYIQLGSKKLMKDTIKVVPYHDIIISIDDKNQVYKTELEYGLKTPIKVSSLETCKFLMSNGNELFIISDKGELRMILNPFEEETNMIVIKKYLEIGSYLLTCNSSFIFYFDKLKQKINKIDIIPIPKAINSKHPFKSDIFYELTHESNSNPIKLLCNDTYVTYSDDNNVLNVINISTLKVLKHKCIYHIMNCHLSIMAIQHQCDLVLLDPINKTMKTLNLATGVEKAICTSCKLITKVKTIFSVNLTIYLIDVDGNLSSFNQYDGNIIKRIAHDHFINMDTWAVHCNYLYAFQNGKLTKVDLSGDNGLYEVKLNNVSNNINQMYSNGIHIIIVNQDDEIHFLTPKNKPNQIERLEFDYKAKIAGISKVKAKCFYKNHIIYYDEQIKSIISVNMNKEHGEFLKLNNQVEDFPKILFFINNNCCLACITKNGSIYNLQF